MSSGIRSDVRAAAARGNPSTSGRALERQLIALSSQLPANEKATIVVSGLYNAADGIIALTERRLIVVSHFGIWKDSEDFALQRVTGVEFNAALMFGTLKVHGAGKSVKLTQVPNKFGQLFARLAREQISASQASPTPVQPIAPSPAARLLELKKLLDADVLTRDQYEAKAAPLIAEL